MNKIEIDKITHTISDADTGEKLVAISSRNSRAIEFTNIVKDILTPSQFDDYCGDARRTFSITSVKKHNKLVSYIQKYK